MSTKYKISVPINFEGFQNACMPDDVFCLFDDFLKADISETADAALWNATLVDGGSDSGEVLGVADGSVGGWLTCSTNDADNDMNSLQVNGESFQLASGKPLYFETKLYVNDIDTQDLFVGLSITDATIIAGGTDMVGFRIPDGTSSQNLTCLTEKNSSETVTDSGIAVTASLATAKKLAFFFDGDGTVVFYIDDEQVASHTLTIPDDEALTPSLEIRNASAAASTLYVDYVLCSQAR